VVRVDRSLDDLRTFPRELATDAFAGVPGTQLLTGLRGKDVLLVFVESYGRTAIEDPSIGPGLSRVLAEGDAGLRAAGFGARSGWLTSSTAGGASWLAHSTLLSGTRVDNPQRYSRLLASDRLTLPAAFHRAGWRTASVLPSVTEPWPEGDRFYGYDHSRIKADLGYRGPTFGWSPMPDQFALDALRRTELGPGHPPTMVEVALTSSHAPWAPLPRMVDWSALGDGSVFGPQPAEGKLQSEVWPNPGRVKTEYGHSIEYSVTSLVSYLQRYGTEDTVLVFLGDHQPVPIVTGVGASRDVPVTVVTKDPAVLAAIDGWGWDTGLKPGPEAPVLPMERFRDRFLAAYSPQAGIRP
jgi:hypothetical protein